jgi:hypothetical protein
MKYLAVSWAICAVLPAQQIRISGAGDDVDDRSPLMAETGDSLVVTLPGTGQAILPPADVPPSPLRPPVPTPAPPAASPAPLALSAPSVPPAQSLHSILRPSPKSFLPAEFERDSGFFCQKLISAWTERDAYNLLGAPLRRRPAFDADQSPNGQILAYADPTGRYRLIELDFAQNTGLLRTVFAYPWKMRWQECRRLWGAQVQSTEANKGRTFYSYVDRRLDVLVDAAGNVISLGLY